jgi:hypothetical protein
LNQSTPPLLVTPAKKLSNQTGCEHRHRAASFTKSSHAARGEHADVFRLQAEE